MAHYAKLGANNKVIAVHVVADKDCQNADGVEDEEVGRQFLERIHNYPHWVKTSYNTQGGQHKNGGTPLRGNYAGIGMIYDEDNDLFLPKKPFGILISPQYKSISDNTFFCIPHTFLIYALLSVKSQDWPDSFQL